MDNIDVLRQNGFEVETVAEATTDTDSRSPRLHLVAQPVSRNTVFDLHDLEELINLMRDQPAGQMVRCSKARAMFAMRACRKSIMVGKALDAKQMTAVRPKYSSTTNCSLIASALRVEWQVVRHMGTMEQPWNCPHGRPTMRHLSDLMAFGRWDAARKTDWEVYRPRI